jgi:riboflavin kinase/FMN adenylyltransferase
METILGIDQLTRAFTNPVVTLGNFDGVHLGHQMIFKRVIEEASKINGEAVVITFEPHPLKVLSPRNCPPLLTPFKKKMMLMERSRVKTVICIPFTLTFAETPPFEFVKSILVEKINVRKVIVGYNYHFGKKKSGDAKALQEICNRFGVEVEVIKALTLDHLVVSSSKIRELIKDGEVEKASRLLGRDYLIIGKVIEGAKRGKTLGVPTANLEMTDELYPKIGVYAVEVIWGKKTYKGVANIGLNPTFQPTGSIEKGPFTLEVHLLNFSQTLYGEEIQVNFKRRIRDEIRFDSSSHLIGQIRKDIQWAEENVFNQ